MRLLAFAATVLLAGCDGQLHPTAPGQSEELASANQRVNALEARLSALEQTVQNQQQAPRGNWTQWRVNKGINGGYPRALSSYSSKSECLSAAASWLYTGGKIIAQDPVIYQLKDSQVTYECLPVGVNPYAH